MIMLQFKTGANETLGLAALRLGRVSRQTCYHEHPAVCVHPIDYLETTASSEDELPRSGRHPTAAWPLYRCSTHAERRRN